MFRFNPAAFPFPAAGDRQLHHPRRLNPAAAQFPLVPIPNPTLINHNNSFYPNAPTESSPAMWTPPPQLPANELSYLASDEFRMYGFKIAKCLETRSHDWTICPYAHPGERARRRDPRKVDYMAIACPEFRARGWCIRGETCLFAHGVFEYWLHPARYRTRACNSGEYCRRKVCFFAHGPTQLRPETRYRFTVNEGTSGAVYARPGEEFGGGGGMPVVEEVKPKELRLEYLESLDKINRGVKDNGGSLMSWGSNLVEYESEFPNVDWINDLIE